MEPVESDQYALEAAIHLIFNLKGLLSQIPLRSALESELLTKEEKNNLQNVFATLEDDDFVNDGDENIIMEDLLGSIEQQGPRHVKAAESLAKAVMGVFGTEKLRSLIPANILTPEAAICFKEQNCQTLASICGANTLII